MIRCATLAASQLEHRLARKIERRLGLGNEEIAYQALLAGDISLYPAFTILLAALRGSCSLSASWVGRSGTTNTAP